MRLSLVLLFIFSCSKTEVPLIHDVADQDIGVAETADENGKLECVQTCEKGCPFGFKKDKNGCEICECRECKVGSDCKVAPDCTEMGCTPEGECVCVKLISEVSLDVEIVEEEKDILSEISCQPLICDLVCQYGFKKDTNGCEICECNQCLEDSHCNIPDCPKPKCKDGSCECGCPSLQGCDIECEKGLKTDKDGCPICECKTCLKNEDCPNICKDPVCNTEGDCECEGCPPFICDLFCPFGFKKDANNCDICACRECNTPKDCPQDCVNAECTIEGVCLCGGCPPLQCKMNCPDFGLKKDENGCDVCECAECKQDSDCTIPCPKAFCDETGTCRCDCSNFINPNYKCPNDVEVPLCACTSTGVSCLDHPEYQCPTLCTPFEHLDFPCPDGSKIPWCDCILPKCQPVCKNIGSNSEGWYDSCDGSLLLSGKCAGCKSLCGGIGTKSEGWVAFCGSDFTKIIKYDMCAPRFECKEGVEQSCNQKKCTVGQYADFTCKGDEKVKLCECDVPGAYCPPICKNMDTANEGWYDSCTGNLLKKTKCKDCKVSCDLIGSKSEGWYSSCDGLIKWANCATGEWICKTDPMSQCNTILACSKENEGYILGTNNFHMCCPGLTEIDEVGFDPKTKACAPVDCLCKWCTYCGDHHCIPPENPCNCPQDCPMETSVKGIGGLCGSFMECDQGLGCVKGGLGIGTGVCTKPCKSDSEDCPKGFVCMPINMSNPQTYCLESCAGGCKNPLTCGSLGGGEGCFSWPECDPINNLFCPKDKQCRVVKGQAMCGQSGDIGLEKKCDPSNDLCGPKLMCSTFGACLPICASDKDCKPDVFGDSWDFCLKKVVGAKYGHCMMWE